MANAYLSVLQEHLVDAKIIIPIGIMTVDNIIYCKEDDTFSPIFIDGDYIAKEYFVDNQKTEVYSMLKEYCKDYIKDNKQIIKII